MRERGSTPSDSADNLDGDVDLDGLGHVQQQVVGVERAVQRGELVLVHRDLGEEVLPEQFGVVVGRSREVDEHHSLGGQVGRQLGHAGARRGSRELLEVEAADIGVAPLLGLGVREVELLEDVVGVEPALGQPAGLAGGGGQAFDGFFGQLKRHPVEAHLPSPVPVAEGPRPVFREACESFHDPNS